LAKGTLRHYVNIAETLKGIVQQLHALQPIPFPPWEVYPFPDKPYGPGAIVLTVGRQVRRYLLNFFLNISKAIYVPIIF